jgi:lysophospholipase
MVTCGAGSVRAWSESGPEALARIRQSNLTACPERYGDEQYWYGQEPDFRLGPPSWGWLAAAFRSMARHDDAALRGIGVPVLIVATANDKLVSAEPIRRAARLIPGAEMLMFPEAGHEILREVDPIRTAALARIDHFLDGRAPV